MTTLQEIRQKYPQYDDLNDQQLADSFHSKFYSDLPKDQFYEKIGLSSAPLQQNKSLDQEIERPFLQTAKNITVGTLGNLGDLAQEAVNLPSYIGNVGARAIEKKIYGDNMIKPFDTSKINTVSPMIRKGFDKATGGLTAPRNKTEQIVQDIGEIGGGIIGPGAIESAAKSAANLISQTPKKILQKVTNITPKSRGTLKAFEDAGINPRLADISEGQGSKVIQNSLANFPFARASIEKATQEQIDNITKQLANITKSEGGTIPQAGKIIQQGSKVLKTGLNARTEQLYNDLDKFIPKQGDRSALISTNNLRNLETKPEIQDVIAVGEGQTNKILDHLKNITDQEGNISYDRLKIFRSTVGRKLQSPMLGGDERGAIKQIYGALSEDMKSAIINSGGGEKGLQAFNKANNAFARHTELMENKINPLIKAKTPSKVYDLVLSGTKQGGTDARLIMRSLDPLQKDFVRGTIIKEMGLANEGLQGAERNVFSTDKFLTEYNKMKKVGAERNLFAPEQNEAIDKLNVALRAIKETGKARQSSNNLPYLQWLGLGVGLGTLGLLPTAGALASGKLTAELMTNPKFVSWLAKAPKITEKMIPQHLKQLSIIASQNPAIRENILTYLSKITEHNDAKNDRANGIEMKNTRS